MTNTPININDLNLKKLGNSLEISVFPMKFESYNVKETKNKKYIVGKGLQLKDEDLINTFEGKNPMNDFNLLLSLINLVKKSLPEKNKNEWKPEKIKKTIPLKNIKEWINNNE